MNCPFRHMLWFEHYVCVNPAVSWCLAGTEKRVFRLQLLNCTTAQSSSANLLEYSHTEKNNLTSCLADVPQWQG